MILLIYSTSTYDILFLSIDHVLSQIQCIGNSLGRKLLILTNKKQNELAAKIIHSVINFISFYFYQLLLQVLPY